ncbi:YbfB/YjiJ family MFS transporter [Alphaproteobacteria bacterium]|jgi:predicted MFS family arabinose efflux permease|nr:YbfB/YjiJ family MFS transporter [Alphaproteobacteria bacterium]
MSSEPRSMSLRYALAGALAMAIGMGIGRFAYTPILPGMMEGLGLTASDAGLIASANYVGYLIGAILAGGGWGQGRERSMAYLGTGGTAVLTAAMGLTDAMPAFLLIRFVAGIASAFMMIFLSTIIFSQLARTQQAGLQSLHFGGVGLGITVSAIVTGAVFVLGLGWQMNWFAAAGVSAIAFMAVVWLMGVDDYAPPSQSRREPPLVWNPALAKITLAYAIFGAGYIVTATFLIAIVRQSDGGFVVESGVWLAAGLAGAPSVWLWSLVARRLGLAAAFGIGCVVEAVGVVASVSIGGYGAQLLAGALLGGTFIAVTAMGLQIGRAVAGDAPRRALAIMTAAFGVGQITGPLLAGIAADLTGSFFAPSIGAAVALMIAGLVGLQASNRPSDQ